MLKVQGARVARHLGGLGGHVLQVILKTGISEMRFASIPIDLLAEYLRYNTNESVHYLIHRSTCMNTPLN